jgi:hypothetical protein
MSENNNNVPEDRLVDRLIDEAFRCGMQFSEMRRQDHEGWQEYKYKCRDIIKLNYYRDLAQRQSSKFEV